MMASDTRPAQPGELCACGRPALQVIFGGDQGPTGYCGRSDGGHKGRICAFCGARGHGGRCERYQLRPEVQWYERPEKGDSWHVASCLQHAEDLVRYRFQPIGPFMLLDGQPFEVKSCAICNQGHEEFFERVERCTCETDPRGCPQHGDREP